MHNNEQNNLLQTVKNMPHKPGVYLFRDVNRQIVYIGKAKDLHNRVGQYVQRKGIDLKADSIFAVASHVECIVTENELEALLLEAQLIQNHQPRFNVLLKAGQPFLYITVTQPTKGGLPALDLVRTKTKRGIYFGPFLEKGHARAAYEFLIRTFRLKICKKKIPGGCLYYHLGTCAGSCREDFDETAYRERLGLAQIVLQKGKRSFFQYLQDEITQANKELRFERSRELHSYLPAFERVFGALDSKPTGEASLFVKKDVWVLTEDKKELWFFDERDGVLKKREAFYLVLAPEGEALVDLIKEYFLSVYRQRLPAHIILTNVDFGNDAGLFQEFLKTLHELSQEPVIQHPDEGYYAQIVKMALIQCEQERRKKASLPALLKKFLLLPAEPRSIDCFDISHKQGSYMVGACVRFVDGKPDPDNFRRFKIKTVEGRDDYACLREVVSRRYAEAFAMPDLVLIDGGKGQLHAVDHLFPLLEFASLAKREETVFSNRLPEGKKLDIQNPVGQVLIALRDYTHHFAISYHRLLADRVHEQ